MEDNQECDKSVCKKWVATLKTTVTHHGNVKNNFQVFHSKELVLIHPTDCLIHFPISAKIKTATQVQIQSRILELPVCAF